MNESESKTLSCGIVLINKEQEILMIHSTGQRFWDIPKGTKIPDESEINAAIRELKEETGIDIDPKSLIDLSWYFYNSYKDLWLFIGKMPDINLSSLECSSTFVKDGLSYPEADEFKMVPISEAEDYACGSMARLMRSSLVKDVQMFYNRLNW